MKRNTIIYTIPGLGTDSRIYSRLDIPVTFRHLDWVEPLTGETLDSYCWRMAEQITDPGPVYLMGVSFGGMVAQKIASIRPVKKVLLISSIRHQEELPWNFSLMRYLPLYYLSRGSWRIKTLPLWSPAFGITIPEEQHLLKDMFSSFTDHYRMWAVEKLVRWEDVRIKIPVCRLHGTAEKVFPLRNIRDSDKLEGGTHFMIYQQAPSVGEWILRQIRDQ